MSRSEPLKAENVIAAVESLWGSACGVCAADLIGHDVVLSILLGFQTTPRCAACLARGHGQDARAFLTRARQQVRRLDCYRAGWTHSDARLARAGAWPEERFPEALRLDDDEDEPAQASAAEPAADPALDDEPSDSDDRWDAGDMGCGDLVLELRLRLADLGSGRVLRVRATDPGAPADLPAWCRVTRNALVRAAHPLYWIRARGS